MPDDKEYEVTPDEFGGYTVRERRHYRSSGCCSKNLVIILECV